MFTPVFYLSDLRRVLAQNLAVTAARVITASIALLHHHQAQARQLRDRDLRARNVERAREKPLQAGRSLRAVEVDREVFLGRGPGNWTWGRRITKRNAIK